MLKLPFHEGNFVVVDGSLKGLRTRGDSTPLLSDTDGKFPS